MECSLLDNMGLLSVMVCYVCLHINVLRSLYRRIYLFYCWNARGIPRVGLLLICVTNCSHRLSVPVVVHPLPLQSRPVRRNMSNPRKPSISSSAYSSRPSKFRLIDPADQQATPEPGPRQPASTALHYSISTSHTGRLRQRVERAALEDVDPLVVAK